MWGWEAACWVKPPCTAVRISSSRSAWATRFQAFWETQQGLSKINKNEGHLPSTPKVLGSLKVGLKGVPVLIKKLIITKQRIQENWCST